MSGQEPDYFYYKDKKYVLIDVEKGKQIIDHGVFNIPESDLETCSGCWRGYIANYYIDGKFLYGTKQNYHTFYGEEISDKVPIYYIATQGSSGYGTSVDDIEDITEGANIHKVMSIYCKYIPDARERIGDWVKELNN